MCIREISEILYFLFSSEFCFFVRTRFCVVCLHQIFLCIRCWQLFIRAIVFKEIFQNVSNVFMEIRITLKSVNNSLAYPWLFIICFLLVFRESEVLITLSCAFVRFKYCNQYIDIVAYNYMYRYKVTNLSNCDLVVVMPCSL